MLIDEIARSVEKCTNDIFAKPDLTESVHCCDLINAYAFKGGQAL
jgi:hypothetical protein